MVLWSDFQITFVLFLALNFTKSLSGIVKDCRNIYNGKMICELLRHFTPFGAGSIYIALNDIISLKKGSEGLVPLIST